MENRQFGSTGLSVSEICFDVSGLLSTPHGNLDKAESIVLLQQAHDYGINTFTTDGRGNPFLAEELIVEALRLRRHDLNVFVTKPLNQPAVTFNIKPAAATDSIRTDCERSLMKLRSDYIDNFWIVFSEVKSEGLDTTLFELERLKQEGKIRSAGISVDSTITCEDKDQLLSDLHNVDSLEFNYNILNHDQTEPLVKLTAEISIGLIVSSPHAGGLLIDQPHEDRQTMSQRISQKEPSILTTTTPLLAQFQFLQDHHQLMWDELAIAFCLTQPSVSGVLPRIADHNQLIRYIQACEMERPCQQCMSTMEAKQ